MTKNKIFIVGVVALLVLLAIILGFSSLSGKKDDLAQNKQPISKNSASSNQPLFCQKSSVENPDVRISSVYECKDLKGNQVFEINYAAEDFGSDYLDKNQNKIARCGMFADDFNPGICKEIMQYVCNRDVDLRDNLCANNSAGVTECEKSGGRLSNVVECNGDYNEICDLPNGISCYTENLKGGKCAGTFSPKVLCDKKQ